jgi:hypothetical protein
MSWKYKFCATGHTTNFLHPFIWSHVSELVQLHDESGKGILYLHFVQILDKV